MFVIRSHVLLCQSETSSQLLRNFTVNWLKNEYVDILSVFSDKLLVSARESLPQLSIYSREGRHLTTITTKDNDTLLDAAWTPQGNIIYTTAGQKEVVVMSESGKIITSHTQMTFPQQLSVSTDNIIYLADSLTGVYQSTDGLVKWTLVFKPIDGWHCNQVIKVNRDDSDDFWTLESNDAKHWHLRVHCIDRGRSNGNATWRNINVSTTDNNQIGPLLSGSSLSYDGNMNILLSDYDNKAVHVFSVNGQHHCQLLSSNHINTLPHRLAVDKERQLLYVGQVLGIVEVFKLTYEKRSV